MTNTSDIGDFWIDDTRPQWDDKSKPFYVIRKFTNEPPINLFNRNKDYALELLFFFLLLIVGGGIVFSFYVSVLNVRQFVASILFESGIIPALQLLAFEVTRPNWTFKKDDLSLLILSAVFIIIALFVIYPSSIEEDESWGCVTAESVFQAGLMYMVTRALFLVPDRKDEILDLKAKAARLKQIAASGLAVGYFLNYVSQTAIQIRDASNNNSLELTYANENKDPVDKDIKRFIIILPTKLDRSKDKPIADFINKKKKEGLFKVCQMKNNRSEQSSHSSRVNWVIDVISTELDEDFVIDIPTTLDALFKNVVDQCKSKPPADLCKSKPPADFEEAFQAEVNVFKDKLYSQLEKDNLEKFVTVVEVNDLEDLRDHIKGINDDSKMQSASGSNLNTNNSDTANGYSSLNTRPYAICDSINEPITSSKQCTNRILNIKNIYLMILFLIGFAIIWYLYQKIFKLETFFGPIFFKSGFEPLIQLLSFEVLKPNNATIPWCNNFKIIFVSLVFMGFGYLVYPNPDESGEAWGFVVGKSILEAVLIYCVTRVLFFLPDPKDTMIELQQEVNDLESSMALGLADGYFWNHVTDIAKHPSIKKRLLIIVPRKLDQEQENPIKDFIKKKEDEKYFDCEHLHTKGSRPKSVTKVIGLDEDIFIDIPTTITSLFKNTKGDEEKFQTEVCAFTYRIAWLLKKLKLDQHVAIVEVRNLDDLLDEITNINNALNKKNSVSYENGNEDSV
jgi:hypothetical protein